MKANWKVSYIKPFEKANNVYIQNYENNNSVHVTFEGMGGRNKEDKYESDVGRWKVKYYFEI